MFHADKLFSELAPSQSLEVHCNRICLGHECWLDYSFFSACIAPTVLEHTNTETRTE